MIPHEQWQRKLACPHSASCMFSSSGTMNRKRGGVIPAAADLDSSTMRLVVNEFDAKKEGKELDITYLDPGKIDMDLKCCPFKEAFLNKANNIMGVDNDPLYYVISPDQPSGWVPPNAFKQQMYKLPHTGAVYNMDKRMLWGNILK